MSENDRIADVNLPSRLREGSGVGQQRCDQPTPLRLTNKFASLAAPPAGGRGDWLAAATSAHHPKTAARDHKPARAKLL